jgi:hypothetical protein
MNGAQLSSAATWPRRPSRRLLALAFAGLVALVVIWATYSFEIRDGPPAATYWRGLVKIYTEYSQGYPTFLFGQVSRTGWWYYFPVTFALKTPLPTLILLIAGCVLSITQGSWRRASIVLIPPALSMTAAISLRDVAWNRNGTSSHLRDKAVDFLFGIIFCNLINLKR